MAKNVKPLPAKVNWKALSETKDFKQLVTAKARFVVPAFIFFMVFYFLMIILVGFYPEVMAQPVLGKVNIAYLFALSQFLVAFIIAALYVKAANQFDQQAEAVLKHHHLKGGK